MPKKITLGIYDLDLLIQALDYRYPSEYTNGRQDNHESSRAATLNNYLKAHKARIEAEWLERNAMLDHSGGRRLQ